MMKRTLLHASWLVSAALGSLPALAGTLPPGGQLSDLASGTNEGAEPQLAGTVVETRNTRFSYEGWFLNSSNGNSEPELGNVTGVVQSSVVLSVDGTYDFYWRIAVSRTSFLPVARFTLEGWAPGTFNANWRSDGQGTVSPAFVSAEGDGTLAWAFGQYLPPSTEIYPGESSFAFFLDTEAHAYGAGGTFSLLSERDSGGSMNIDWGGSSRDYRTFAPVWSGVGRVTEVPEPGTWMLLGAGLAVLVPLGRRRSRRPQR
jgi:hypothetical protein